MREPTITPGKKVRPEITQETPIDRLVWVVRTFLGQYKPNALANMPLCSAKCPNICDCDLVASLDRDQLVALAQLIVNGQAATPSGELSERAKQLGGALVAQCRSINGV